MSRKRRAPFAVMMMCSLYGSKPSEVFELKLKPDKVIRDAIGKKPATTERMHVDVPFDQFPFYPAKIMRATLKAACGWVVVDRIETSYGRGGSWVTLDALGHVSGSLSGKQARQFLME